MVASMADNEPQTGLFFATKEPKRVIPKKQMAEHHTDGTAKENHGWQNALGVGHASQEIANPYERGIRVVGYAKEREYKRIEPRTTTRRDYDHAL